MDIEKIQRRIEEEKYKDMSALQKVYQTLTHTRSRPHCPSLQDFMQLCVNTQQYNEDGSLIFEDSIILQSVFNNARERLELVDQSQFFSKDKVNQLTRILDNISLPG